MENLFIRIVRGDFSSLVFDNASAISPISVLRPMPVTIAEARPVTTVVPAKTMFCCSVMGILPVGSLSAFFSTAMLSPVRGDSSTVKLCDSVIRISAAILSPDSKNT